MKNAMDKYRLYQTEDFLQDESFINWVLNPEEANNKSWAAWVKSNPYKKETVQKAIDIIRSFDFKQEPVAENFYTDLKQSIDQTIGYQNQATTKAATLFPKWLSVAAVVTGILLGGALVYYFMKPSYTVVATPYAATKTIWLPDSSEVVLNAHSKIRYLSSWQKHKREVWITGEAFFKVRHITTAGETPHFKVYTANAEIEVLGTEFNVKSTDNTTGVMLQRGKVKFSVPALKKQTIMQPDDYCQYDASLGKITTSPIDPELYTSWMKHKYRFEKTPAREVCQTLTAYFGYSFIFRRAELSEQHISGTLELQNEQLLLNTLSELLNASITKNGKDIIIE
ncbi:FecR family protein [Chitinophaga oryziterrae]|nr:FecR family protein [Chitinophaga oryziterrae]